MITLLVQILVLALVFGLVWWILTLMPVPPPFLQIVRVVVALIFLLLVLGVLFGGVSMPFVRL